MIDLRSDTLTTPTAEMRKAMYEAEVGDAGRTLPSGKGEDPTLNALEDKAAELTGKQGAVFLPSGTMANMVALLSHCSRGDQVAVEENLHLYRSEKGIFDERFGGLKPAFYATGPLARPNPDSLESLIAATRVKAVCIENTHNFAGGTCLSEEEVNAVTSLAARNSLPVHMDGARIFNAAAALDCPVSRLVASVDSVMFCLSKGLGAPIGSMLCGSADFIQEARKVMKQLGGILRQAGVIAAAGLVALQDGVERLHEDHENAKLLAEAIADNGNLLVDLDSVQTNIVMAETSPTNKDSAGVKADLEKLGLKVHAMTKTHIRMVTYRGITKDDVLGAASILNKYCASPA